MNTNLKSGTNEVHGVVFEILQNKVLNANRWENNRAGTALGPFKQNQYGVAMGGPIIKNRLFIFGDYQGTRIRSSGGTIQNLGYGGFYTIPTPAMINGDFSKLLGSTSIATPDGGSVLANQIFDPKSNQTVNGNLVRTPFPGNIIPKTRFDQAAYKLMSTYPAPNQPIPSGKYPQNDYFVATPGMQNTDQGDGRVDYKLSDKDNLFGSLSWSNLTKTNQAPLPGALEGGDFRSLR